MRTKKIKVRQGFTIVELVIVIGVIGVLTAVLIPTFINLNKKAEEASNQSFVKNLNTQMAIREQSEGKNATMFDAVDDAREIGFDVEKLTPVNGRDLVWDSVANRFLLLNEDGSIFYGTEEKKATKDIEMWKIYSTMPSQQKYSIYAKAGWNVSNITNLSVGFDVGSNKNIESISYQNAGTAKEVVIRTSSGELEVNAPNDTVHHYAVLDTLDVKAIAGASYHEHGSIRQKATVEQGHVVVEKNATIGNIVVPATAAANSVKLTVDTTSKVQALLDYSGEAISAESKVPEAVSKVTVEEGKAAWVKSTNAKYDDLQSAFAATVAGDTLIMLSDASITSNTGVYYDFLINKSITFDGNGFALTTSRTATGSANTSSRVFQIDNLETSNSIDVNIKNLKNHTNAKTNVFVSPSSQFVNLKLSAVDLKASSYPINVRSSSQFINITIEDNSVIKGWCALNFYGSLSTLKISDSTLHGLNTYTGNSNEYAVIVLDGGTYWGTAAGQDARANAITIDNSTIIAEVAENCCEEFWISFQYGSSQNAQVTVNNTKILDKANGNDKTSVVNFNDANTGDSITMALTNAQVSALRSKGLTVTDNEDGTYTVKRLA